MFYSGCSRHVGHPPPRTVVGCVVDRLLSSQFTRGGRQISAPAQDHRLNVKRALSAPMPGIVTVRKLGKRHCPGSNTGGNCMKQKKLRFVSGIARPSDRVG